MNPKRYAGFAAGFAGLSSGLGFAGLSGLLNGRKRGRIPSDADSSDYDDDAPTR